MLLCFPLPVSASQNSNSIVDYQGFSPILVYHLLPYFLNNKETHRTLFALRVHHKNISLPATVLQNFEYEKPAASKGSAAHCFPSQLALQCQPKYLHSFILPSQVCISQMVSPVSSLSPRHSRREQLAFPTAFGLRTGCHHLSEQRILNPHSRCDSLFLLEIL